MKQCILLLVVVVLLSCPLWVNAQGRCGDGIISFMPFTAQIISSQSNGVEITFIQPNIDPGVMINQGGSVGNDILYTCYCMDPPESCYTSEEFAPGNGGLRSSGGCKWKTMEGSESPVCVNETCY